jgi:hypothetical protein
MIKILRSTINSILDLYLQKEKSFYNFSFFFALLSIVWSFMLGCCVIFFGDLIYKTGSLNDPSFLIKYLYRDGLILFYFSITNIGLYAIYLGKIIDTGKSPSMKGFFDSLTKSDWLKYFIVIGVLVFFYAILFVDLFDLNNMNQGEEEEGIMGVLNSYSNYSPNERLEKFYLWCNSMQFICKFFAAYIAASILLVWSKSSKMDLSILKKYRSSVWAVMIVAFCLESLSGSVNYYFKQYFLELISIPFKSELFKVVVGGVFTLLLVAYFCLAFAGAILFTVSDKNNIDD